MVASLEGGMVFSQNIISCQIFTFAELNSMKQQKGLQSLTVVVIYNSDLSVEPGNQENLLI